MRYVVQTSPYSVSPASSSGMLPVLRSHNVVISHDHVIDFLKLNFLNLDSVHEEAEIEITALRTLNIITSNWKSSMKPFYSPNLDFMLNHVSF